MDLEFDKEMDALLRRAAGRDVLAGDGGTHLDADTIAAFAENALPQKCRTIYTQHLAACDPCRVSLANLISMNAAAEPAMAAAAAPIPAVSVPWYRRLFHAPNLAYVMGGLVLIFGGVFGVFVLQNAFNEQNATVSMIEPEQARQTAPARAETANSTVVVNSNANSASNVVGEIPQSVGVADQPEADSSFAAAPPPAVSADAKPADTVAGRSISIDGTDKDSTAGATQPVAVAKEAKREEDEKAKNEVKLAAAEQELRKQDSNAANIYNQQNQVQMTPGAGNKTIGPNRADVQRDNRGYDSGARMDDNARVRAKKAEAPTTATGEGGRVAVRNAGGKKFELKQGAWYDTAYSGQATTNVQRGSDQFRALDSGLRNIANSISGTVVVVWKGKAYRIQ